MKYNNIALIILASLIYLLAFTIASANVIINETKVYTEDLRIGGDLRIENVYDSTMSSYSETTSGMGGLEGSVDISQQIKQTVVGSEFNVKGSMAVVSGGDTTIIGSKLHSDEGDVDIYTGYKLTDDGSLEKSGTGGSFYEGEAYDYEYSYEYHEKTSFMDGLKNLALAALAPTTVLFNDDIDLSFEGGKLSAGMKLGEKTSDALEKIKNTAVGSSIMAEGGGVNIVSDGDVTISGSELMAGGDINVVATNDINVVAAKNTEETRETHESTEINATATVGNAYVDAGMAGMALIEAGKAVDAAKDALDDMEALYSDGKATQEALDGAIANLAIATVNLANATIAAAQSVAQAAAASGSSLGTGVYASAGVNMETSSSTSSTTNTTYTGSQVGAGGNISFNAGGSISYNVGGDMVGLGYNAVGKRIEADIKGNLTLTSLQDEGNSSNKSMGVGAGTDGSANLSMSQGGGDYKQTNMSSLVGTEGVDINVDGKLSLTGSAIVNAELDDNDTIIKDLGNLNISAGSFEYEDLTDYSENSQTGFSVAGGGSSTTLGATNTGSETEGKSYATIGNGTVTIKDGSAIDYLNRAES